MTTICIDTETFYSDECTVKTLGNHNYVRHPDWDCYMVSIAGDNGLRFVGPPEEAPWDKVFSPEHRLISHNTGFDEAVIERLHELGYIPKPEYAVWDDTADLVCYLGLPRGLKPAAKALLGVEMSKDVRDNMKNKRFSELSDERKKEVADYAMGDAVNTLEIWTKFSHKWPEEERWLSRHTREMGKKGLPINKERLSAGIESLTCQIDEAVAAVPWFKDTGKVLSRDDLEKECAKVGVTVPKSLAKDDPECVAWEDEYGDKLPFIGAVRNYRRCNMFREKLLAIHNRIKEDGCSLLNLKYFGGHCVTAGHEVLTETGWVPIEQWSGGKIAQWDPITKNISFDEASTNKFVSRENLVQVDSPFFRGVFTEGHTLPYQTHGSFNHATFKAGQIFQKKSFYAPTSGVLRNEGTLTPDQMRLLVAVQADGHWTEDSILQFCLRKPRKIERLRALLSRLGIPFREAVFPSCRAQTRLSISRSNCPPWLCKSRKVFGPWLLDSTGEARKAFVDELSFWDGYRGPRTRQYYSSIAVNVEWVSILCHLTGSSVGNCLVKDGKYFTLSLRDKDRAIVKPAEHARKIIGRGETVFCPTTKTGFWLYRYRNTIAVTGNTGRWSGDGGVNYQNLPRGEMFGVNMRELIEAPAGKTFVVADLSQIEARITLWFAQDRETLDLIRGGMDLYEAHARATMGYNDPMKLKDYDKLHGTPIRQMAKVRVLGLGFGCGWEKFIHVAKIMGGVTLSPSESAETVQAYRQSNKKITALWRKLEGHLARHASTGQDAVFELPSGRPLSYRDVRRTGGKLTTVACQGGSLFRKSIWGGVITENLVQATARDVLAYYIRQLTADGLDIRLHVHDEIVIMCDECDAPKVLQHALSVMSVPPPWISDLPIAAEGSYNNRYTK